MINVRVHSRSFLLRYYEMDCHASATPLTMLSLFEETAFSHAESTEWPVYRLRDEGLGWVLLHGNFSMLRYPRYREPFTVETWIEAASRFYGRRCFSVRDGSGELLGSSVSTWVFFDLTKHQPAPIFAAILSAWGLSCEENLTRGKPDIYAPPASLIDERRHYEVRRSDIDTNGHVNNVNYLEWALEAVPAEVQEQYYLSRVDGRYLHEVRYGQMVRPACERLSTGEGEQVWALAVYADPKAGRPGSSLVSSARSVWKKRD